MAGEGIGEASMMQWLEEELSRQDATTTVLPPSPRLERHQHQLQQQLAQMMGNPVPSTPLGVGGAGPPLPVPHLGSESNSRNSSPMNSGSGHELGLVDYTLFGSLHLGSSDDFQLPPPDIQPYQPNYPQPTPTQQGIPATPILPSFAQQFTQQPTPSMLDSLFGPLPPPLGQPQMVMQPHGIPQQPLHHHLGGSGMLTSTTTLVPTCTYIDNEIESSYSTFARFSAEDAFCEPRDLERAGASALLRVVTQPFYQADLDDGDSDGDDGGDATDDEDARGSEDSMDADSGVDGEGGKGGHHHHSKERFPFILKLATKRKEEEHMRFGFALDPSLRGRPILLTIKEEILQRPPRKEKANSSKAAAASFEAPPVPQAKTTRGAKGNGGESGGSGGRGKKGGSPTAGGGGSGGRGKGKGGAAGKRPKMREDEKEEGPEVLFHGRIDPGTSGTGDMRASSIQHAGLTTPLHWSLDRTDLALHFKAAEGSGMNIIRYQFHVQALQEGDLQQGGRLSPAGHHPSGFQGGPVAFPPVPPAFAPGPINLLQAQHHHQQMAPAVKYVGFSAPAIICSHSTSQFQRALLSLIHYHFRNHERIAQEDVVACFKLLGGKDFKPFVEAFLSYPTPAGSIVCRGTDIPAILDWFLSSWKIFSVDNYMALYNRGLVFGFLGRDQARDLLINQEEGVFIIRLGSNGLSMSIKCGGQIMPVEIDPNTLKQISITVAADPAVYLLCRNGALLPKEKLIDAIRTTPRFGYVDVARLTKERRASNDSIDIKEEKRSGEEGENKRKRERK